MKCNCCWKELRSEVAFITTCSHLFCEADARRVFATQRSCPICDTALSGSGIKGVELTADDSKTIQLFGLNPKEICEISSKAISFWAFQMQLEQVAEIKLKEKSLNEKLLDATNQITNLKRKVSSMSEEIEKDKAQIKELQDQCAERAKQKRKLEEMYDSLRQEVDDKRAPTSDKLTLGHTISTTGQTRPEYDSGITLLTPVTKRFPVRDIPFPSKPPELKDRFALVRQNSPFHGSEQAKSPSKGTSNADNPAARITEISPMLQLKRPTTPLFSKRKASLLSSV